MKKLLLGFLSLTMAVCFMACGVSGKNVTGVVKTNNMVYFEPKCPECKHVGLTKSLNISAGEEYEGNYVCDKCGKVFEISLKR